VAKAAEQWSASDSDPETDNDPFEHWRHAFAPFPEHWADTLLGWN
jgi:hypothetical protein